MRRDGAIAVSYSTVEQFVIPLRGSREFGLERAGIARLLMLSQAVDIVALLPLSARWPTAAARARVVGGDHACCSRWRSRLVGFGALPLMAVGCALFGV